MFALLVQQHSIYIYKEILRNKIYLKYALDHKKIRGHPSIIHRFLVYPLAKIWCDVTLLK